MQRRTFLVVSIAGGLLLAGAGYGFYALRRRRPTRDEMRTVIAAIAPAMLAGAGGLNARGIALGAELSMRTIEAMPPAVRQEIEELFALLLFAPTRRMLTGIADWSDVTPGTVAAFLSDWRVHRFALFQVAYHALHDLIIGPWYSEPSTWSAIGYPGPLQVLVDKGTAA